MHRLNATFKALVPSRQIIWAELQHFCTSSGPASTTTLLHTALHDRDLIGRRLKIKGWVKAARKQKEVTFLDLDDGLYPEQRLQVVINRCLDEKEEAGLRYHAAVSVEGTLRRSDHPAQEVELLSEEVHLCNSMGNWETYPFAPRKVFPADHTRQFPMLRAKLMDFAALLRVRNTLGQAIHGYFQQNGFVQIQTPILTSNDCEGAGEVFEVKPATMKDQEPYFSHNVFLTVSGQLHLEAVCNGIAKVYNFSPVFRAERGRSRRHLSEFTMIEAEMAFLDDLDGVLRVTEELVKHAIKSVMENSGRDVDVYSRITKETNMTNVEKAMGSNFAILTYDNALSILDKQYNLFKSRAVYGQSLGKEHELYLVEKHCKGIPVFIVEWPQASKPFYARKCKGREGFVDACDLLLPSVGELVGGSLRESDYNTLEQSVCAMGIEKQSLQWYLDLRRCGSAPTGGFGLGFERLVQFLLGVNNIKDTLPFPRSPHFCIL